MKRRNLENNNGGIYCRMQAENEADAKKLQLLHIYEKKARELRKLLFSEQKVLPTGKEETQHENNS